MSGRRIIMNDGTVYEDGQIGYSRGVIWCNVVNTNIISAFQDFTDHNKTSKLIFEYGEMSDVYEEYTEIGAILQSDNTIQIMLKKEV